MSSRPLRALALVALLVSCKDKPKDRPANAVPDAAPPQALRPLASASASARRPPRAAAAELPPLDGGAAGSCRVVLGPVQQALTGPAALVASARGLEVVQHKSGIAVVTLQPIVPPKAGAAVRIALEAGAAEKASRPPCAVADRFAFCSDAQGRVHKSLREMASDELLTTALAGARVTAAPFGDGRTVVGTIQTRKSSLGEEVFEAFAKVDGEAPVRISEEGSGASDVVLAARRSGEVVAFMTDARVSMSPVHVRTLRYAGKLEVMPDVVVHVAGGSTRFLLGAQGTSAKGDVFGLVATESEKGFGLLSIPLEPETKEEAPFAFSPYPNGLDSAALAATRGGNNVYVARVRPTTAPGQASTRDDAGATLPPYVLELGRLDDRGRFASLGFVATSGPVSFAAVELDSFGALWLYYTDPAGSWLERRVCP